MKIKHDYSFFDGDIDLCLITDELNEYGYTYINKYSEFNAVFNAKIVISDKSKILENLTINSKDIEIESEEIYLIPMEDVIDALAVNIDLHNSCQDFFNECIPYNEDEDTGPRGIKIEAELIAFELIENGIKEFLDCARYNTNKEESIEYLKSKLETLNITKEKYIDLIPKCINPIITKYELNELDEIIREVEHNISILEEILFNIKSINEAEGTNYIIKERFEKIAIISEYSINDDGSFRYYGDIDILENGYYNCSLKLKNKFGVNINKDIKIDSNKLNMHDIHEDLINNQIESGLIIVKEREPQLIKISNIYEYSEPFYKTEVVIDGSCLDRLSIISPFVDVSCNITCEVILDGEKKSEYKGVYEYEDNWLDDYDEIKEFDNFLDSLITHALDNLDYEHSTFGLLKWDDDVRLRYEKFIENPNLIFKINVSDINIDRCHYTSILGEWYRKVNKSLSKDDVKKIPRYIETIEDNYEELLEDDGEYWIYINKKEFEVLDKIKFTYENMLDDNQNDLLKRILSVAKSNPDYTVSINMKSGNNTILCDYKAGDLNFSIVNRKLHISHDTNRRINIDTWEGMSIYLEINKDIELEEYGCYYTIISGDTVVKIYYPY